MHIPNNPSFMGGTFLAQWLNVETPLPPDQWSNQAGMTTSNGVRLTISSVPPRLGMCFVSSVVFESGQPVPSIGTVYQFRAAVMRFAYR